MDSSNEYYGIIEKLDNLQHGQSEIEKNIGVILERIDQRDSQYNQKFCDINTALEKAGEGRKVLHQKQDAFDKRLDEIQPTINQAKGFFANSSKILWGLGGIILIGILANAAPAILERLN